MITILTKCWPRIQNLLHSNISNFISIWTLQFQGILQIFPNKNRGHSDQKISKETFGLPKHWSNCAFIVGTFKAVNESLFLFSSLLAKASNRQKLNKSINSSLDKTTTQKSLQNEIYHVRDESRSFDLDMRNWLLHFNFLPSRNRLQKLKEIFLSKSLSLLGALCVKFSFSAQESQWMMILI